MINGELNFSTQTHGVCACAKRNVALQISAGATSQRAVATTHVLTRALLYFCSLPLSLFSNNRSFSLYFPRLTHSHMQKYLHSYSQLALSFSLVSPYSSTSLTAISPTSLITSRICCILVQNGPKKISTSLHRRHVLPATRFFYFPTLRSVFAISISIGLSGAFSLALVAALK